MVFQYEIGEIVNFGNNNYAKEIPESDIKEILYRM